MKDGVDDIKKHKWFKGLDWKKLAKAEATPPMVPTVASDDDTSNFDKYPEEKPTKAGAVDPFASLFKEW